MIKLWIYIPEQLAEGITFIRKYEFIWCWQATNKADEHQQYEIYTHTSFLETQGNKYIIYLVIHDDEGGKYVHVTEKCG